MFVRLVQIGRVSPRYPRVRLMAPNIPSETTRLSHSTSCVRTGTEWVVARPTPSRLRSSNMMRRSSPASRSFVLARSHALRALHLTPAAGRHKGSTRSYVQTALALDTGPSHGRGYALPGVFLSVRQVATDSGGPAAVLTGITTAERYQ